MSSRRRGSRGPAPALSPSPGIPGARTLRFKRAFDVAVATLGLTASAPALLLVAALIKIEDGGPVIFRQERAGQGGRPFVLLKFRSMIVDADKFLSANGEPTVDRVTRIGRLLRKWSIDEIPQLVNVVRGDMSIIGPRPMPPDYVDRLTTRQLRRLTIRPGLTGLAQVSGRHSLPWSERIELDLKYIERLTWRQELVILARTVSALRGHDALLDRKASNDDLG